LLADLGLLLIILIDDLGGQPADLAAEMIKRELEAVTHVIADSRGRPAERCDEPDLGTFLRRGWRGRQRKQGRENSGSLVHIVLPRSQIFVGRHPLTLAPELPGGEIGALA
jgi:hypothetical protein